MSISTYRRAGRALPAALTFAFAAVLVATPAAAAAAPSNVVPSSTSALPTAPPWGACGRSTPEDKVVRQFPVGRNQLCFSRVVFLNNRQTGQLVRQQIVRVYVDAVTRNINSAHPRERRC